MVVSVLVQGQKAVVPALLVWGQKMMVFVFVFQVQR